MIEFHLEHLGSDGEHFAGNVCVEPKDLPPGEKCPVNKRVNLGINEDFELKVGNVCIHSLAQFLKLEANSSGESKKC